MVARRCHQVVMGTGARDKRITSTPPSVTPALMLRQRKGEEGEGRETKEGREGREAREMGREGRRNGGGGER